VRLGPLLAFALVLALASACGGGEPVPVTPTATPPPTPTATPVASLREVDFADPSIAGELIDRAGGGEVHQERVLFGDLIPGGDEEAVVIVDSGGTAGEIGAGVYRLTAAGPELVFFVQYTGRLELRRELIATTEGVYSPGDAQCCPSRLRETVYQWDGGEFVQLTEQVIDNPNR
jgi:hypothetical protein